MNDITFWSFLADRIYGDSFILLSLGACALVTMILRRIAPIPSNLALSGLLVAFAIPIIYILAEVANSQFLYHATAVMRVGSYVFLVAAVFVQRPAPGDADDVPTSVREYLRQWIASHRALLGKSASMAAIVFLMGASIGIFAIISPFKVDQFKSVAKLKLWYDTNQVNAAVNQVTMVTECEVIKSPVILSPVVDELELNRKWGHELIGSDILKTSETLLVMSKRLEVAPIEDSSVLVISVRTYSAQEAADVANAIGSSYVKYVNQQGVRTAKEASPRILQATIIARAIPAVRAERDEALLLVVTLVKSLFGAGLAGVATFSAGHWLKQRSKRTPTGMARPKQPECANEPLRIKLKTPY